MNNLLPYSFITVFFDSGIKDENDVSIKTPIDLLITSFTLSVDIKTNENSKITCAYHEGVLPGDYGILKNSYGVSMPFRIITKQPIESDMDLTVATGINILKPVTYYNGLSEDITVLISNLSDVPLPATVYGDRWDNYVSDLKPFQIEVPSNGTITSIDILKAAMKENTIYINNTVNKYGLYVELFQSEAGEITLNLKDEYKFLNKQILFGQEDYDSVCVVSDNSNVDFGYIYEYLGESTFIKTNTLHLLDQGDVIFLSKVVKDLNIFIPEYEGQPFAPYNYSYEYSKVNIDGTTSIINYVPIIKSRCTRVLTYKYDPAKSLEDNSKLMFLLGLTELYKVDINHEIIVDMYISSYELDFSNLEELFLNNINLIIEGQIIKSRITRYEYSGDSTINITFGNVRTKLTDKLKMREVL